MADFLTGSINLLMANCSATKLSGSVFTNLYGQGTVLINTKSTIKTKRPLNSCLLKLK
ncbi:hypothetical protein N824_06510 [Pedobacter sp. V48]|nr:hypothetical protein N824_06510 [Pedobacter sp. V48]